MKYIFEKTLLIAFICITLLKAQADNTRYHFEATLQGWEPHIIAGDTAGCTNVQLAGKSFLGNNCLEMQFTNLVAFENPPFDRGEAWVDVSNHPPNGYPGGSIIDMSGKLITYRVYVSTEMYNQNFNLQFQVWDDSNRLCQQQSFNYDDGIIAEGWFETNFDIDNGPHAWVASGFDSSRILHMGLKLGTGPGPDGPGSIYLDSIYWNENNLPPNTPSSIQYPESGVAGLPLPGFSATVSD
ncbi:MAG TPA: hypothetical protein VKS21_08395, partial [Spirochaetota bacterium]|nr:hypothetical protein [Spirochaetota bacterium]